MLRRAVIAGDPLFADGRRPRASSSSCSIKTVIAFAVPLVAHGADGLGRAQGPRRHDQPHRPQPGRAVGHPPDPRRRRQAVHQGGPDPRPGRPAASSGWRRTCRWSPPSSCSRSCPFGGDFNDGNDGTVAILGPRDLPAARRPADRHPGRAGAVVDRGLRRDARRLVVGLEVPAARLGAGVGPDGELRGRPRARRSSTVVLVDRDRCRTHDMVVEQARPGRGHPPELEHHRHRRRAVRDLPASPPPPR